MGATMPTHPLEICDKLPNIHHWRIMSINGQHWKITYPGGFRAGVGSIGVHQYSKRFRDYSLVLSRVRRNNSGALPNTS